jgi:hypothetical protein
VWALALDFLQEQDFPESMIKKFIVEAPLKLKINIMRNPLNFKAIQ